MRDDKKPQPERGRPALSKTRRNRVVTLVTDDEYQSLKMLADREAQTMSSFIHHIIQGFLASQTETEKGGSP